MASDTNEAMAARRRGLGLNMDTMRTSEGFDGWDVAELPPEAIVAVLQISGRNVKTR
jgi:hypothetical protein